MKILVTGVKGQLGYEVVKCLEERQIDCIGVDKEEFDITDLAAVRSYFEQNQPTALVHCAAYTAVDKAEDEPEICRKVNAEGVRNLAIVCKEMDIKMLYISTDYVFPGTGQNFYEVDDVTGPLSQYGKTKLEGEEAVKELLEKYFIVRISWVFGKNGANFVKTMLRLGKEREELTVVADQIGSPTYTKDLAPLLCDMIVSEKYGTYHATNEGTCSWAEFARQILWKTGAEARINEISSQVYGAKAVRPCNSVLSKKSLDDAGLSRLPHWEDALTRYLMKRERIKQCR